MDRLDPNPLMPFCIQTTVRVARGDGCLDDRELGRNQQVQSETQSDQSLSSATMSGKCIEAGRCAMRLRISCVSILPERHQHHLDM